MFSPNRIFLGIFLVLSVANLVFYSRLNKRINQIDVDSSNTELNEQARNDTRTGDQGQVAIHSQLEREIQRLRSEVQILRREVAIQTSQNKPVVTGSNEISQSGPGELHSKFVDPDEDIDLFLDRLDSFSEDFAAYDSDGSGSINITEVNLSKEEFDEYDLDEDGGVEEWEIEGIERLMQRADSHADKHDLGNGQFPIEKDNYEGWDKRFRHVDTNNNGRMEQAEYYEFLKVGWSERRKIDINKDGKISKSELGLGRTRFDYYDDNKNGFIEDREIRDAIVKGRW